MCSIALAIVYFFYLCYTVIIFEEGEFMKELIENMTLTKRSIFVVFLIVLGLMLTVCLQVGFSDKRSIIVSIIVTSILFFVFLGYMIYVLCLYYKLPKNKTNKMGVLFFINTHNNSLDYSAITNKFCEKFEELSEIIDKNKLTLIILTEKQVSSIKNVFNHNTQHKLLKKTKCLFGVFMKATDLGKESDEYELQMNAMITHPWLNSIMENILSSNFNYIFKGLHSSTLNKKSDLKNLQNLSTQLYYVCQLIFGVANEYSGFQVGALQLFKEIENKIKYESSKFYKQLLIIVNYEICSSSIHITSSQYNSFVYSDKYDEEKVKSTLETMSKSLPVIKNDYYTINYHLAKAVYHLICGRLIEAKGEISLLTKTFSKIKPNQRPWAYSDAFLTAYENKPSKYKTINEKYKLLKNNKTQDSLLIYYFIEAFLKKQPSNLGLKLALLLLVYYKKDEINCNILPTNLQQDIVDNLKKLNQVNYAKFIQELEFQ